MREIRLERTYIGADHRSMRRSLSSEGDESVLLMRKIWRGGHVRTHVIRLTRTEEGSMNASRALHLSSLVLACAAAACMNKSGSADTSQSTATAAPSNDPAARKAIEAVDSQFVAAFKSGNATAAAALYEQDAVS